MSARQLIERLRMENPEAFEDYVVQNVPTATIERWLRRKTHMSEVVKYYLVPNIFGSYVITCFFGS